MGIKNNDFISGRDVYFLPAGDNNYSGLSVANAVATPTQAIAIVNAMIPPPSASLPASINASETGAYTDGITTPDRTTINCEFASIITTDLINIDIGNRQSVLWGALVNNADNGVNCMIDGKSRVALTVNALVAGSDGAFATETVGNIGIKITGTCDDIFIDVRQVELRGDGATGIEHSADTATPLSYTIDTAEFFNENQCLLRIDATDPTEQIEFNISAVRRSSTATEPTTNSTIFEAVSGIINSTAQSLSADNLAVVGADGQLAVTVVGAAGDISIANGGSMLINAGFLAGDIVVDSGALLGAVIIAHVGTVTNNGTINGIIGGVRYGNHIVAAEDVTYDNATSGLIADDVQEAIDELEAGLDQENVVYVSKVGDDSDSGLNPSHAKLTLSSAITAASAMSPTASNQVVISIIDAGEYSGNINLPSFIHINGAYATYNGRITINDDCVVKLRRAFNTLDNTQQVFRKNSGAGKASISCTIMIVDGSGQEGVRITMGTISFSCTIAVITAGIGLQAKSGSEMAFAVGEVILLSGGTGIGTRNSGGGANTFIGTVFRATDDGTGILIETKVDGDAVNIQGGVYEVDTLFDLGANTTLNAFANIATGARISDPTATVNITNHSGDTSHAGLIQSRTGFLGSYFGETLTLTSTTHTVTTESEIFVDADAAGGDVTITLPLSATRFIAPASAGQKLTIKNISPTDTFNVNVNRAGSDNIENKTTALIRADASIVIDPDGGTNWWIVGEVDPHKVVLIAASFVDQEPTLIDTPLQIEFGAAQGSGSDPVSLAADGTITFNEDGFFTVTVGVQYGRANVNLVAILHFRLLLNGVQVNNSATAVLSTDTEDVPFSSTFGGTVSVGDEFTVEIIRDSDGTNDGGLFTKTVTAADWADSPSASIRIVR